MHTCSWAVFASVERRDWWPLTADVSSWMELANILDVLHEAVDIAVSHELLVAPRLVPKRRVNVNPLTEGDVNDPIEENLTWHT